MNEYAGNWLSTLYTPQFHFLNPTPIEVNFKDIAHSLALVCRFGGHCHTFYSVAEHSYLVSLLLGADEGADAVTMLAGLLHDAEEAYLPDIPSPIKVHMPEAQRIYEKLRSVIYWKFGIDGSNVDWVAIKSMDKRICISEAKQLGLWNKNWYTPQVEGELPRIPPLGWTPHKAELLFTQRYKYLMGMLHRD